MSCHTTGTNSTSTFADSKAEALFHSDGWISSTVISVSPGMTISVPSGGGDDTGYVSGTEVEL